MLKKESVTPNFFGYGESKLDHHERNQVDSTVDVIDKYCSEESPPGTLQRDHGLLVRAANSSFMQFGTGDVTLLRSSLL